MIFSGNEEEWLDFINAILTKMKETGEYERLLDKWFGPVGRALWRLFEPKSELRQQKEIADQERSMGSVRSRCTLY
jgi:hypothetical protein